MFRKANLTKQMKGVSKDIRKKFNQVLDQFQLDLRVQSMNKQQNLQKMQIQLKKLTSKVNKFSNLLLDDNFQFLTLQDHPLIMIRYCQIILQILIDNIGQQIANYKPKYQQTKNYNENNVYEVVAVLKLENFDLKEKIKSLEKQFELAKQRADCAQKITLNIQTNTQQFLKNYEKNFVQICDLLKKAQNNQVQLLQNNRYLKEQLQVIINLIYLIESFDSI